MFSIYRRQASDIPTGGKILRKGNQLPQQYPIGRRHTGGKLNLATGGKERPPRGRDWGTRALRPRPVIGPPGMESRKFWVGHRKR